MSDAIERVSLTHLQIPLKEPLRVPSGEAAVKDAILVTLETASGVGYGESSPAGAPAAGALFDTPGTCWDDLKNRVAVTLLGRTFSTPDDIAALASTWPVSPSAAAGAETACWDLLGRSRHATVAELLGASAEQIARGVESGLSVGLYPTVVELLETIETHLAEGYRRVKIKIRPGEDVGLVRAVRQHFGDIPLMVDAGGAYTANDLEVFRSLDDFDLLMIEQPLAAREIDGLADVQSAIATPVCLGESAGSAEQTLDAVRRGAGRIVNIMLQRVGGLGPARAVHDLCFRHGVACWVGATPELGVGQAHGIHLAALGNCRYPTDVGPSARWFVDDFVAPVIELSAPGLLSVPTRPGLGFEVDRAKVRRYQVRHQEFTSKTQA